MFRLICLDFNRLDLLEHVKRLVKSELYDIHFEMSQMSLVIRKSVFCICENKDADYREADQRLCFRFLG